MKNSTFKRCLFVALLLVLIVGTILGHADVALLDRNHVTVPGESPATLQLTMDEIAKRTQPSVGDAAAGGRHDLSPAAGTSVQPDDSANGMFPLNFLLRSDL